MTLPSSISARAVLHADRETWLAARGIGGSEVAAIRGTPGAFQTAWDVWVDRQPGVERIERDREILDEGLDAEPYVIARYERATGRHVERTPGLILRHPEFPWATGSPDGFVDGEGGLELKTAREMSEWGPSGEVLGAPDETLIPAAYLDQVYWYLEISGLEWWDVAALIPRSWGMPELRWYRVLANREHQRRILLEVARWRQRHLVEGHEPPIDDSPAARRWLDRKGASKRPVREATDREAELVARLAWARAQRDRFEREARQVEAELAESFGDETYGVRISGLKCLRVRAKGRANVDMNRVRAELPDAISHGREFFRFNLYPTKEK